MDTKTALDKYRAAVGALVAVINDPAASAGDIIRAQRAIDDLSSNFIEANIDEVHARTVQFRAFVSRMESLLAALKKGDLTGPVTKLTQIVDASNKILGSEGELEKPSPPVAGPPGAGPAKARIPVRRAKQMHKIVVADDRRLDLSAPKTTRPEPAERRELPPPTSAAVAIGRKLDAQPDRIDIRDWPYQPSLDALPPFLDNRADIPQILDQGQEGACTGFALAAVINFLLAKQGVERSVSPRMIYEMARRYDEWPGETYEGSSARGGIKGWVAHGVCEEAKWKANQHGLEHLTVQVGEAARSTPGGAYYRVMHREVRDVHAAINETGAVYATLMVHAGWDKPGPGVSHIGRGHAKKPSLKIIQRRGNATDGHAVALVGYNHEGFIVQNSWGKSWGDRGFALLPYEDFLLHATDVWVAQLGVPVSMDLWSGASADTSAGLQRAAQSIPLETIRPYVVDIGNNGELSDSGTYWTSQADLQRLFEEIIPTCVDKQKWDKARVLLYLHGGLNDEVAVAKRVLAFRDKMLANRVYPVHIMWETGAFESLRNIIRNVFSDADERAGAIGDWLRRLRDNLVEAKDRSIELTLCKPGTALWDEMKRNARVASEHQQGLGGMQLISQYALKAIGKVKLKNPVPWELHVVGHSAGSIFAAYALQHLIRFGKAFKTLQFMAPAVTVDLFKSRLLPFVGQQCPHPTLYVLSDVGERDDTVGPYGKSLLYLVSNAFQGQRETRILGMERFVSASGSDTTAFDAELDQAFKKRVDGLPSLVVAGAAPAGVNGESTGQVSRSQSHGGFDNDPDTMNSILHRILGRKPEHPFAASDLRF